MLLAKQMNLLAFSFLVLYLIITKSVFLIIHQNKIPEIPLHFLKLAYIFHTGQ